MEFISTDDLQKFANCLTGNNLSQLCISNRLVPPPDFPSRRVDKVEVIGNSLVVKTSFPGLPEPAVQENSFRPGRYVFLLNPEQSSVFDTVDRGFWTFRPMPQPAAP